ncbi:MAG TPA: helix-turn-helix domain-containing protein [Trueperaceae bacterium]
MKEMANVCPRYHHAVELLGRRWTGAIVVLLLQGVSRFNELAARIPEMSDRMLSERLKELEAEGIVERSVKPETPVRVEYSLTEKGKALQSAVSAISAWAENWLPDPEQETTEIGRGRQLRQDSAPDGKLPDPLA